MSSSTWLTSEESFMSFSCIALYCVFLCCSVLYRVSLITSQETQATGSKRTRFIENNLSKIKKLSVAVQRSAETHDKSTGRVLRGWLIKWWVFTWCWQSFILLSELVHGNYHLGPLSPIAVWAILGSLRSPVSDVCCWVNLQLWRPGPATSDGINRENMEGWEGLERRVPAKMLEGGEQRGEELDRKHYKYNHW